ncbi:MAG: GxxExxY protein [Candidatus Edwardsbacteria bacterium]|jgi:GxxExxY protein|nr:GxxExxY protein [Candidatus Edwardsbacteria bacterium]
MDLERKELTGKIIACGIEVHTQLGPGFLESIHHAALLLELKRQGLQAESQKEVRYTISVTRSGCTGWMSS